MTISRLNFEDISEADLQSLIDGGVREGTAIDYKAATYGGSDDDKKEFLKDVSSFANTHGGHLVIGMAEDGGVPTAIVPMTGDFDVEQQRMESLLQTCIQPRITGVRMRPVPVAGGHAIVLRVPRSWNPPHRSSFKGVNRYFVRNSSGAHEASVEELRAQFNVSATAHDRVRAFRQERIAAIAAADTPVIVKAAPSRLIIHVIPLSAFPGLECVDLQRAKEKHDLLRPIGTTAGYSLGFNFDGYINYRAGELAHGYTQLYRNGPVEAVKVDILRTYKGVLAVLGVPVAEEVAEVVPRYIEALRVLEVPPPLVVAITLDGVRGAALITSEHQLLYEDPTQMNRSTLALPDCLIEDYGDRASILAALRPAFDALWNSGGRPACPFFAPDGTWTGAPH